MGKPNTATPSHEAEAARHELERRELNRERVKQGQSKLKPMSNLGRPELEQLAATA